ncbi:class I SAM-dependent methyltransferase [Acidobacteriota bacterium]
MKRLTDKQHWEEKGYWSSQQGNSIKNNGEIKGPSPKALSTKRYDEYLLFDVIFRKLLPLQPDLKAVELGSAPGDFLVKLRQKFGYDVYGVEYSKKGAEKNQDIFVQNDIPNTHVFNEDCLSEDFLAQHKENFDLVISRGLIEHFTDPHPVIMSHLKILRPGGNLVVSIPNLRGIYYFWSKYMEDDFLDTHNFDIMARDPFRELFKIPELEEKFCGYYGTFVCGGRYSNKKNALVRSLVASANGLQFGLNPLFRGLFGSRGFETSFFSPYLMFIGTKKK